MFGAERNIGSGSQGRKDKSRSDSTHERLFLECKHRQSHSVVTLWDDAQEKAVKEGKVPVVILTEARRKGSWILVKDYDLRFVADQLAAQLAEERKRDGEEKA